MIRKNKLLMAAAVVLGVVFVAGVTAVAVSNYGTQSNPLVTKSYIDNVVKDDILSSVDDSLEAESSELQEKFSQQVDSATTGSLDGTPSSFETITLDNNEVIRCGVGAQIIVRSGSATCYGNGPVLTDATSGSVLNTPGDALTNNHLYVAILDKNGLRARSNGTVIMVSGSYTIYDNL